MTVMKHKSVAERKNRRQRYINAVEPFRQKYNCTAGEVFGVIQKIENENRRLQQMVEKHEEKNGDLLAQVDQLHFTVEKLESERDVLKDRVNDLTYDNADLLSKIHELQTLLTETQDHNA